MIQLVQMLAAGVTDDSGNVVANGTVTFYTAGTTTLQTVYEDFELEDPHSNPATLDAAGKLFAYAEDRIKCVISDSTGAVVRTVDNIGISSNDINSAAVTGTAGNGLIETDNQLDVNVDGSTLTIEDNVIKIPDGGVTSDELANDITVTTIKVGATGPTLSDASGDLSCDGGIKPSGQAILTSPNSKTLSIAGKFAATSAVNPGTNGLSIVRGRVGTDGSITTGEGFTVVRNGAGDYTVTFTTAFSDIPTVTVSPITPALVFIGVGNGAGFSTQAQTTTVFQVLAFNSGSVAVDQKFAFIAIGQKA